LINFGASFGILSDPCRSAQRAMYSCEHFMESYEKNWNNSLNFMRVPHYGEAGIKASGMENSNLKVWI